MPMSPIDEINIGSDNGLVPSGNKPLPEPVLTKIFVIFPQWIYQDWFVESWVYVWIWCICIWTFLYVLYTLHTISDCEPSPVKLLYVCRQEIICLLSPISDTLSLIQLVFILSHFISSYLLGTGMGIMVNCTLKTRLECTHFEHIL